MPQASTLQRILYPLAVDEFVDRYFQRLPLKVPGSSAKFDFLFRQGDFQLKLDRVTKIRAVFSDYREERTHPADIKRMLDAGATICVTGMEKAHPKLANAARLVRSTLNYAGNVSFRAYLSPPGGGFNLHFDARVTTTLQIAGTRRWWFSNEPAIAFPTHNSGREPRGSAVAYKIPKLETLRSVVLRPGDLLCLPAGVWHCAKGRTVSLALNMAFDHYGAGVFDSITGLLERRLLQDPAWREPLPAVPRPNARRVPPHVAAVMRERIDALQTELAALRGNEAELTRAWQMMVRSKPPA